MPPAPLALAAHTVPDPMEAPPIRWGVLAPGGIANVFVDAVYVASPHSEHHEHALLALRAGKPVLVEKAFTRSLREADEVLATAEASGLLAAEAMWSRYLPHYDVIRRTV